MMPTSTNPLGFLQDVFRGLPDSEQLEFVLGQIAGRFDGSAVLFDARGDVLASIGEVPVALIREAVAGSGPDATAQVGRWAVRVRRSGPSGGAFTLVLASRTKVNVAASEEFLIASELAITAALGILSGTDVRRMRENAHLLETLEQGIPAGREHRYWPRLVEFGFIAHGTFLVVVAEDAIGRAPDADRMRQLADDAAAHNVPVLLANRLVAASSDAVVHALLPDTAAAREWLRERSRGRVVGISAPHSSLVDVPRAVREAEFAHRVAGEHGAAQLDAGVGGGDISEVVDYPRLGPCGWLVATAPAGEWRSRRRALLAPFDGHHDLLDTLIVYLATHLSVGRTAEALFLHANTVRYRIGRIEALLDRELHSPFAIADLTAALGADITARRDALRAPGARRDR